jgi:hypothetical protein
MKRKGIIFKIATVYLPIVILSIFSIGILYTFFTNWGK